MLFEVKRQQDAGFYFCLTVLQNIADKPQILTYKRIFRKTIFVKPFAKFFLCDLISNVK